MMKIGTYRARVSTAQNLVKQLKERLEKIQYDSRGDGHWANSESKIARQELTPKIQQAFGEARAELLKEKLDASLEASGLKRPQDMDYNQRRGNVQNFLAPLLVGKPFDEALQTFQNVLQLGGDYNRYMAIGEDYLKLAAIKKGENEHPDAVHARLLQLERAVDPHRPEELRDALRRERFYDTMLTHNKTIEGQLDQYVKELGSGRENEPQIDAYFDKMVENAKNQAELK